MNAAGGGVEFKVLWPAAPAAPASPGAESSGRSAAQGRSMDHAIRRKFVSGRPADQAVWRNGAGRAFRSTSRRRARSANTFVAYALLGSDAAPL